MPVKPSSPGSSSSTLIVLCPNERMEAMIVTSMTIGNARACMSTSFHAESEERRAAKKQHERRRLGDVPQAPVDAADCRVVEGRKYGSGHRRDGLAPQDDQRP